MILKSNPLFHKIWIKLNIIFFSSLAMSGPRVSNEIRVIPLTQAWPSLTGKVELLFLNPFYLRRIFLPTNSPLLLGWSIATIRLWISTRRNTLCVKPMIIVSLFFGLFHLFFLFSGFIFCDIDFSMYSMILPLFHSVPVQVNNFGIWIKKLQKLLLFDWNY